MPKHPLLKTLPLLLLAPTLALASADGHQHVAAAPAGLEARLEAIEARQAELYHSLEQKKTAGLAAQLTERLSISGLLEIEAAAGGIEYADGSSDAASDLSLATAQLGLASKLNDNVGGSLIFLYEEGGTLEVDEATVDLEHGGLFARAGRHYLPFGAFHSHFVSDPLTLGLGETRASALQLGYKNDLVSVATFAFNGANAKTGAEDHLNDGGASLSVTPLAGLEFGASYLSDLAESNAALLAAPYARRVDAWSAFLHLERGPFFFEAEYLAAARAFAAADLDGDGDGSGDRPRAWNLEVAYNPLESLEVALRYEGSDEFAGQPQRQYGAALSWSPWEHTSLALEYLRGDFDAGFGGGIDRSNLVTTQLAYEF